MTQFHVSVRVSRSLALGLLTLGLVAPSSTAQSAPDKVVIWGPGDNAGVKDWAQDPVVKEIEKATNTDIEVVKIPWEVYGERLNAAVASGKVPDLMGTIDQNNKTLIAQLVRDGVVAPFEGPVAAAAPNIVDLYKKYPLYNDLKVNGKIYGNPILIGGYGTAPDNSVIHVRQDLLSKLRLKVPNTFDELFTYLKTCQDKTGLAGLVWGGNDFFWTTNAFMGAYGLPAVGWTEKSNGSYGYWAVQPGAKNALLLFRKMVAQKLIDPNAWNLQYDEAVSRYVSGNNCAIITNGGGPQSAYMKQANKAGKGVIDLVIPAPSAGAGARGYTATPQFGGLTFLGNLRGNNPVAAARVLNFLRTPKGGELLHLGVEGKDWRKVSGKVQILPARATAGGFPSDVKQVTTHALSFITVAWDVPEWKGVQDTYGENATFIRQLNASKVNLKKYVIEPVGYLLTSPLWSKFSAKSTELVNRSFVDLVRSGSDAEASGKFDAFVKSWNDQGGAAAQDEMNKVLQAREK